MAYRWLPFNARTNVDRPYINTIDVQDKDGNVYTIDRDRTLWRYDADTGIMSVEFWDCYVWDGEKADYEKAQEILSHPLILIGVDIEDDAPTGYKFEVIEQEFIEEEWEACQESSKLSMERGKR